MTSPKPLLQLPRWTMLLAFAVTGCVVNPIPTPATKTNVPVGETDDSDLRGNDGGVQGIGGQPADCATLAGDALDPAGAVTDTDASDDCAANGEGTASDGAAGDGAAGDGTISAD